MLGPASVEVIVCEPEVAVGVAVPEPAALVVGRGLLDMLSAVCRLYRRTGEVVRSLCVLVKVNVLQGMSSLYDVDFGNLSFPPRSLRLSATAAGQQSC